MNGRRHVCRLLLLGVALIATCTLRLLAQDSTEAEAEQVFDVPAGLAERTLAAFSRQSAQPAVFPTDLIKGVRTAAIKGRYTPAQALGLMLEGTRLAPSFDAQSGTFVVRQIDRPPERVVELPPYVLEEGSVHLDVPWTYARAPGVEVISRCSDTTTALLIAHHFRLHQMLAVLVPREFQVKQDAPVTYVLYNNASQPGVARELMEEMQKREPDAKRWSIRGMSNYRFLDRDTISTFFVINESTFVQGRLSLTTDHVRYLLENRTPSLPLWFIEGLMALYEQSVLETTPDANAINSPAAARLLPEGVVVIKPLRWLTEDATADLKKNPRKAVDMMSLESLFATPWTKPAKPAHAELWRAQAALFIRWALDEGKEARRAALWSFLRQTGSQPVTEKAFKDCFGFGYEEAGRRLRAYLSTAVKETVYLRSPETLDLPEPELRYATDAEVSRIKGALDRMEITYVRTAYPQLTDRYIAQARRTLARSYAEGDRDPRLLAEMGLCECDASNDSAARPFLEAAVRAKVVRPRVYYELARINYRDAVQFAADGKLTVADAGAVLRPLAAALKQSPPLPESYELIAQVWLRVEARLTPAQLAILDEGMRLFPAHPRLVYAAALLHSLQGDAAGALALTERGLVLTGESGEYARFVRLREALSAALPTPAAPSQP